MKMTKKRVGLLAGLLVLSAAVFVPLYAAFANNTPIRTISFKSGTANYDNGDPGAWKIDQEAYWTKKGYADVKLTVNAIPARSDKHYDMVMLIDRAGFDSGKRINDAKSDLADFARLVLSDGQSRMAIISFANESQTLSDLSSDATSVANAIDGITAGYNSNYYDGFKAVNTLLENYTVTEGRELAIVLVSNGYVDLNYPQERVEYRALKEKFPSSKVYGVQYYPGNVSPMIDDVTDTAVACQKYSDFEEALVTTTGAATKFERLAIVDSINSDYFELTGTIKGDMGSYQIGTSEDGTPIVAWDLARSSIGYSGASAKTLTFGVKLKDQYLDDENNLFPINKSLSASSRAVDNQTVIEDSTTTDSTPKLKLKYWVNYVANTPNDCQVVGTLPQSREEIVYDHIQIADDSLTCGDWVFKGWVIETNSAERLNRDYFIMGNEDTTIRGTWGRSNIVKSTEGTPWQESYAMLDVGARVNEKFLDIATGRVDSIKMADELLPDRIQSQSNIISASTSPMNIYAWYNSADTTMYMYSDADVIKGNPNMRAFLNGYYNRLRYVSDISGLADIDMSGVTDISAFFQYNTTLTNLEPIAGWNVSNVTDMSELFNNATGITSLDGIEDWNTSSLTKMDSMFQNATNLSDLSALADWDVTNVTSTYSTFYGARSVTNIDDLAGWRFDNLENATAMFIAAKGLASISGARNWGMSKATSINSMFKQIDSLTSADGLQDWDTSNVTDMQGLFEQTGPLRDISALENWNTSKVTKMNGMFHSCSIADISALTPKTVTKSDGTTYRAWDTSKVKNMEQMFSQDPITSAAALATWDVSNVTNLKETFYETLLPNLDDFADWDTANVTTMRGTFETNRVTTSIAGLANWNTSKVTDMGYMFRGDDGVITSLTGLEYKLVNKPGKDPYYAWDVSHVTDMMYMFQKQKSITNVNALANWDTSSLRNMSNMFEWNTRLNDLSGISSFDTSNVINLDNTFEFDYALTSLADLSGWNVGNVTSMDSTFRDVSAVQTLNGLHTWKPCLVTRLTDTFLNMSSVTSISALSGWAKKANGETCMKPTQLSRIFGSMTALTSLDGLETWDVSELTGLQSLFGGLTSLTNIDALENWNVEKVTSLEYTFSGDSSLTSIAKLSSWNTPELTTLKNTFSNMTSLTSTHGLENWNVSKLRSLEGTFAGDSALTDLTGLNGTSWNSNTIITNMESVFARNTSLVTTAGLEGWTMNSLSLASYMFDGCVNLENIDALGNWTPTRIGWLSYAFRNDAKLTTEDLAVLENWNQYLTAAPFSMTGTFDGIPADVVRPTIGPANP